MEEESDIGIPEELAGLAHNRAHLPVPAPDPHASVPAHWRPSESPARISELQDSLRAYLSEVRQFKMLSREEEDSLLDEYKRTGSQAAAQRLITSNLRLVVKIAMEYQTSWLNNLQDLIQEGNIGLLQALRKFDLSKGVKFSYYANYWIRAYVLKYIMDNWRLVKIGTTQVQRKLFYNLKKEQDKLLKEGFEPLPELLAERLGVSREDVEEMDARLNQGREVSLDSSLGEDMEETQVSLLPSPAEGADSILEEAQAQGMVADKLVRFRKTLDEREKRIMEKRLLTEEPVTLQEIGEEFGVSRERVRQLEERLKKKLRAYLLKELPELSLSD
ncbi:MAG: RNA polymerase factor sigma-32 [Deltaproteobacteria bacterium]|nr:RNA polymerase factor sigma-32 [Deltaproteobacteria bacterium]